MSTIRSRSFVAAAALLGVALAALARPVPSAATNDAGKAVKLLTIKPANIEGTAFYSDGRTPAAKVPVRLWSVDKRAFVHETVTGEYGSCKLDLAAPGRYVALFADRVCLDIVVDEAKGQAISQFKVIVPRGKSRLTREQLATHLVKVGPVYPSGGQAAGGAVLGLLSNPWVIGGIVATAVAVPVAVHNTQSSSSSGDGDGTTTRRRRRRVVSP